MKAIFLSIVLFSLVYSQEECDTITHIDGMTTASKYFKVIKGTACETYAEITWWDFYNNGNQAIQYGTTPQYGKTIPLQPFIPKINHTTRIENLKAGTKYYVKFYRNHNGTKRPLTFEFTTAGQSTNIKSYNKPTTVLYSINNNILTLGNKFEIGDYAIISTAHGKRVRLDFKHNRQKVTVPQWKTMLFIVYMRNGTAISTKKVLL